MSLFQASVLKKYLKEQDKQPVNNAYEKYKTYFFNPEIQQNIRESKEEQFQEGFLRELFVNIFGYTINPNPDYNLTTEYKNETGSKKADGAILSSPSGEVPEGRRGKAIGVIELKSTKTKDLESIRQQAFDYKANQSECVYVITSNFEKLRFYINNAVDFEEFDLFNITLNRFELLYLCLHQKSIFNNLPQKIKDESILQEEVITKKIYADYSLFKRELYQDLIDKNLNLPVFEGKEETEIKLLLFKKSQKLLDRFLFIFFAEDKGLLPPNSIPEIIKQWEQLKDLDEYKPLYERFKKYFGYLNTGWKGKKYEIYGYNGGLFLPDEVLSSITIDDELLKRHTNILSSYDFDTDVDVNILGHIFENSLNEIEEITGQLEGQEVDAKKSKRKKDGVYYTPKYITKYIVDNTVGKLCEEKKEELSIIEEEYFKGRKGRHKSTIKELDSKLLQYRNWLLELTICDPACGSGAFLNQALDFLIKEHHYIDELRAKLFEDPLVFQDVENTILEKNLYGVDINEESVEIAKLSLWLRTAQKGRKLTTLSNNIKCGNSLIDDPEVAGDKAFNWQKEFPNVFKNEGFSVVIGNPPYLRIQGLKDAYPQMVNHYDKHFHSATGNYDIYALFIERSYELINDSALVSFILPHKFLISDFGKGIRSFLLKNTFIDQLVHFGSELVFQDATTYTCVISLSKRAKTAIGFNHILPVQLFNNSPFNEI
ncbi:MAG: Eco57I restriction-modification methylase domain-containing protein, partial [Bacteroidales bacterium]|nr:Eco57I restriction-modification methylase domain-containing protein [Bacteroidales bacterium]